MSTSEPKLVVVKHLSDPASAQLVGQLLRGENIPAYVNGFNLQDEFAMATALLGTSGCDVQVPEEYEQQARTVLAAAAEAGERMASGETEEWKQPPPE